MYNDGVAKLAVHGKYAAHSTKKGKKAILTPVLTSNSFLTQNLSHNPKYLMFVINN